MPNRTILNKYGDFVSKLHKVLKKRQFDNGDVQIINEAVLVAMLSSNHSWKTSRFLHEGEFFDQNAIREEFKRAMSDGWKEINENDIKEVTTSNLDMHAFSLVLTCVSDKDMRSEYRKLIYQLLKYFEDGIEPIENRDME